MRPWTPLKSFKKAKINRKTVNCRETQTNLEKIDAYSFKKNAPN